MKPRTVDRKREAADRYLNGDSAYKIAADYGVSETTIRNWLDELGIPRRSTREAARVRELEHEKSGFRVDRETKQRAAAMVETGLTYGQVADLLRGSGQTVTGQTVRMWCLALGREPRPRSESMRLHRARRDAPLKERLLAEAGACGSPTCSDPACEVDTGGCHRPGCDRQALRARRTDAERHWVRGYPTRFCDECFRAGSSWIDDRPAMLRAVLGGNLKRWGNPGMFGRHASELANGSGPGRRLPSAEVDAVARQASQARREKPDLTRLELVDLLVVLFKGRHTLKTPDGKRRPRRDPTYQAARRWIERRLEAAGVDINPPSA
jgi:transposase